MWPVLHACTGIDHPIITIIIIILSVVKTHVLGSKEFAHAAVVYLM